MKGKLHFLFAIHLFFVSLSVHAQNVLTYNYTGATQTFTVPCGVTSLNIKAWGAGGSGGGQDTYAGAIGGGGAYITSTITVTPGQVLTIIVGGGALGGTNCASSAPGGAGGWGNNMIAGARGGNAGSSGCSGGGGGGGAGTGIFLGTTPLVVAGGGGGGSGGGNTSSGAAGGGGGQNGFQTSSCTPGVAGGNSIGNGTNGGDRGGADGAGGGGGGGGYRGGTGGSPPPGCDCGGCGGGGGSSYSIGTGTTILAGSGQTPGNSTDPLLPTGLAKGGLSSVQGGNGYLIITYNGGDVTAAFNLINTCFGHTAQLTNSSTYSGSPITTYTWNFGDGSPTQSSATPNYSYTTPGTYTVSLTADNGYGCVSTITHPITIYPSPVANFTLDAVCKDPSSPVVLTNTSTWTGSPSNDVVTWTSSDNYTVSSTNFGHIFPSQGVYDVKLLITSPNGCKDSLSQQVTVNYIPAVQTNLTDLCDGETLNLVSNSTIASSDVLTNTWVINQTNVLVGNSVVYNYGTPQTLTIALISSSPTGCADTLTQTITIYPKPVAAISVTEQCSNVPATLTFSGTTNSAQPTFAWWYNNGLASWTNTYTNTFSTVGNNTVTLYVGDVYATKTCYDTLVKTFFVHGVPNAQFTGDTTICAGDAFTYTNQTTIPTSETMTYAWAVNGINASTTTDFTNVAPTDGVFQVKLTATSSFGCTDIQTANLYVYPIPEPPVILSVSPNCPGDQATISATAENGATIAWTGPAGFTSTDFYNTFPMSISQMGTFSAIATSQYGCPSLPATQDVLIANIYGFDDFEFPNVITANGDGINDSLDIEAYFKTCDDYTFSIFNRWGNLVFEKDQNSTSVFDGKTASGTDLPAGVYFYKLVYVNGGDLTKGSKSGYIHIVR